MRWFKRSPTTAWEMLGVTRAEYVLAKRDVEDASIRRVVLEELDRREQRYAEIRNKQLMDAMTDIENPAGKVAGYTAQPDAKVALVNSFKEDEERLLRKIEALDRDYARNIGEHGVERIPDLDLHSLYLAKDYFRIAFMLFNRAVFQPQRIKLPEDGE